MTERRIILAIVSIFIASVALAQKYGSVIDRTVAVVGNSMIPLSQVESEAMMLQFEGYVTDGDIRCEILEELMLNKLFYTQACLDSLTVNMDIVNYQLENKIATIMSRFGSEKEVEAYFGKTMNRLKSEWAKMFEEQSLSDEMKRKVASNMPEITPREIRDFYKRLPEDSIPMIPAMYSYSQIVVYPDREKAALEVKERLLEFRDRVIKGEKFSTLARLYSVCPSAANGGELGMASKNLYWPAFSDAAMALKEGQVSPIVETPDGFHTQIRTEKRRLQSSTQFAMSLHLTVSPSNRRPWSIRWIWQVRLTVEVWLTKKELHFLKSINSNQQITRCWPTLSRERSQNRLNLLITKEIQVILYIKL